MPRITRLESLHPVTSTMSVFVYSCIHSTNTDRAPTMRQALCWASEPNHCAAESSLPRAPAACQHVTQRGPEAGPRGTAAMLQGRKYSQHPSVPPCWSCPLPTLCQNQEAPPCLAPPSLGSISTAVTCRRARLETRNIKLIRLGRGRCVVHSSTAWASTLFFLQLPFTY